MTDRPGWIGSAPTPSQVFAVMFVGVTGIMIAGLQPLLLGALAQEGRLGAAQIGRAATAELLTMGAAAGLAGALLQPVRLKLIAIASLIALAAIDVVTPLAQGDGVALARAAAGAPSGVLIWITTAMIARAPTPGRWAGVYLTVQTLAQFVMATFLTVAIVPKMGADGGFVALAVLCAVNAAAALLLPARLAPLAHAESGGLPPARGWAALAAAFLYVAFQIGVWVYVEPLSRQSGHPPNVAGIAVSLSLACQVAGGVLATLLAGRIKWLPAVMLCSVAGFALIAGFALLPSVPIFLAISGVYGFVWIFVAPFLVPMAIEADPTRRAAVLMGGAQLLGGSFGPLLSSFFVSDTDARGALAFCAGCLALSAAIMLGLHQMRLRTAPAAAEIRS